MGSATGSSIGRRNRPAVNSDFMSKYFKKPLAHRHFLNFFNVFFLQMLQASYSNMRQRC